MTRRLTIAGLALLALVAPAAGQANCALRNPDRQIFEIFPGATTYRTIEAKVDLAVKPRIEQAVGSALARTDEGTHTAYIVLKDAVPIGFVHARAETGARGSVELVWALDLDLAITDFRVQRSRERETEAIKSAAFRDKLVGRDLAALRGLLTTGNDDVDIAALEVPSAARQIARSVVLCAVKTRAITELAFRDAIAPARLLGHAHAAFPGTAEVRIVRDPLGGDAATRIGAALGRPPDQLDAAAATMVRALAGDGSMLGTVVRVPWNAHEARCETWWIAGPGGDLRTVRILGPVDTMTRRAFEQLAGSSPGTIEDPPDGAASPLRCAREILALLAAHGAPS